MAARRANGEGSISKRSDGRWHARLSLSGGKRLSVYGRTKADVVKKLNKAKSEHETDTLASPSTLTLGTWLDHWLEHVQRQAVASSTFGQQQWIVCKHIKPYVGDKRLSRMTADQLDWLFAELERQGVGARTRKSVYEVLRKSLRQAVEKRRLQISPMVAVEAPRRNRPNIQTLLIEQVRDLLAQAEGDLYEALYVLAVHTGMRWGEIAGLQWQDVDLQKGVIHVRRAQREVYDPSAKKGSKYRIELAEPKTKSGRRSIRIGAGTVEALSAHRTLLGASPLPHVRVFTTPTGAPLRRSNFGRKQWHPLLDRAGLSRMGFHSLRHTMATTGLTNGLHAKVIQERLGHSRISQTLDTYSHVIPELHEEAASVLEDALSLDANLTPTGVDNRE
jgi:integrase